MPIGSGNMIGLEFGIPVNNVRKVIEILKNPKTIINIDVLVINNNSVLGKKICVVCVGFRFSATVAESYNKSKKDGDFLHIYNIY